MLVGVDVVEASYPEALLWAVVPSCWARWAGVPTRGEGGREGGIAGGVEIEEREEERQGEHRLEHDYVIRAN